MEKKFDIAEGGARRSVMRFCAFAAALALTVGVIPTVSAEDEPEAAVAGAETAVTVAETTVTAAETTVTAAEMTEEQTEAAGDTPAAVEASFDASAILPDSGELEANYIEGLFYGNDGIALYGNYGAGLSGEALSIYNELKAGVGKIVSGQTTSTVIPVTITDYTNVETNYTLAVNALLVDLPEQLYWYDKTAGAQIIGNSKDGVKVYFTVSDKYSNGDYTVDSAKITAAQTAVNRAREIAAKYEGKSDYDKIVGYCTEICALTEYNQAVLNGTDNDDDAYQMVYVFDGDNSTKVVCEGYSKAFQYLCDMGGVDCYTVTGTMSGGTGAGSHMWNIVTLGGKSYLVDVTNCDGSSIGAPDKLLLKGATTAGASGCFFKINELNSVTYTYDSKTLSMYSAALLTVSTEDYDPTAPVEPVPGGEDETTVTEPTETTPGSDVSEGTTAPTEPAVPDSGSSESVSDSEATESEATGSEAVGSEATGSEATGSEAAGSEAAGSESGTETTAPVENTPDAAVTNPPATVPAVTVPPAVNPVYPWPAYPVAAPAIRVGDGPVQPAVTYTTLSEEQTVDAIAEAGKGGTVQIRLGSNTGVDGAVIKEIADNSGVTAKFTLKNKYVWTIKSESIAKARTVDLGVRTIGSQIPKSLIRSTAGKNKTVQFSLKQSGDFGFKGTLTVPVSKRYNGKYANLYRYNKSKGKLSFVDGSLVEAGKASFTLTEGGAYVIVFDSYIHGEDISSHAGTFAVPVTAEKASAGAVDVNFDMAVWEDEKIKLPSKKIRFRIVK